MIKVTLYLYDYSVTYLEGKKKWIGNDVNLFFISLVFI